MEWAITNTPWSADEYGPIFRHALKVCDNIVFLIRTQNATTTARRKEWEAAGFGLKEVAVVRWQDAGFPPEGLELAAIHWQYNYAGDVRHSKIELSDPLAEYDRMLADITAGAENLDHQGKEKLHGRMIAAAA
jgi:hypothetical protein